MSGSKLILSVSLAGFAVCTAVFIYNLVKRSEAKAEELKIERRMADLESNWKDALAGVEALEANAKRQLDHILNLEPGEQVVISSADTDRYWQKRHEFGLAADQAVREGATLKGELPALHSRVRRLTYVAWSSGSAAAIMLCGVVVGGWMSRRRTAARG